MRASFSKMPKPLSLKKSQPPDPPKNQKSLLSFFKSSTTGTTQKVKTSIKTPHESDVNNCNKRKASSPVLSDAAFVHDKIQSNTKDHNSPKKLKADYYKGVSPPKKNIQQCMQKSPNKENGYNTKTSPNNHHQQLGQVLSPKKTSKQIFLESPPENVDLDEFSEFEQNNFEMEPDLTRRPFTPVIMGNIENYDTNMNVKSNKTYTENAKHLKDSVKQSSYKNNVKTQSDEKKHERRNNGTPNNSPIKELHSFPSNKLLTPSKTCQKLLSPSKSGSTVKALDFGQDDVGDMFGDEWGMEDIDENKIEDLDLSTIQRCEIITVNNHGTRMELKLKTANNKNGTCFVEGIWLDTPLIPGDTISILATRDSSGQFYVGNSSGLLVLRPDHLISSTSVVAGVFCKRKAILQERWKGIDSANTAMTIGILVHELVQKALTQNITSLARLRLETDMIIKESVQMLYDAGLNEEEARSNMQIYVGPLAEFMQNYVEKAHGNSRKMQKDNWNGHVDKVLDIEENLCCPQLGLKGKIDATLQVTIHDRKASEQAIVPLELKSGKASVSAEHRGQLVLYGMMLSVQNNDSPTQSLQRGLLLYLREKVDLREVSCGYPERRDLVMLRNQLAQHLAHGPELVDPEQLVDIEDASILLQQRLPDPVHHENACSKCAYLTLCSLHLWHTDGPSVSETHPLSKLRGEALGHLTAAHINYFLQWTALLKMEEKGQSKSSPLHALWTDSVEKRTKRGTCASNLILKAVEPSRDRLVHMFERKNTSNDTVGNSAGNQASGPQEGEFSIVSIVNRPWIAAGVVLLAKEKEIHILLERDLSRRQSKENLFHIDTYESYATTVQNLTNLGVLMEDSERADRLRKLIIDKSPPEFEKKLPREVGRLGAKLMRSLNIEQQRAVLKAITAKDYALLQGLPGTGKTQTISVLIQMLVSLKQRVLVTAHTHSAVDTVLTRLPDAIKVMRLGSSARVAPSLLKRSEQTLIAACETPEQLGRLYESMEVVGVTCLGAAHAMLSRTVFDICIVDEATQVLQCTVLRPLFAAKRFVLVGDPEQLPPVVRSRAARRLGMEESLFHRLMSEEATSTLQLQYRMNQALADIANKVAYNDRLKCANEKVAQGRLNFDTKKLDLLTESLCLQIACSPEPKHAAVFLDMEATDNTANMVEKNRKFCTNEDEACVVVALVEALKEGGVQSTDIGVIAPYRDQVSLLRRLLTKQAVEVSTVDQFQGRDKSVIIYSCTRRDEGQDDRKVQEGEVLNDQRRLAVSVTRAKHKLIVVGNSRALKNYTPLQKLIDACTVLKIENNFISDVRTKFQT